MADLFVLPKKFPKESIINDFQTAKYYMSLLIKKGNNKEENNLDYSVSVSEVGQFGTFCLNPDIYVVSIAIPVFK